MESKFTNEELLEIEKQLSCPSGPNGIQVGHKMNLSNIEMTENSIALLGLSDSNTVLEIGHGNCGHLDFLINQAEKIKYSGLEVSETMWNEAKKLVKSDQTEFKLYDGATIPYPDNHFNKILTVNTIYFWNDPKALLKEVERVLKPKGTFVITYADKEFMQHLPFVRNKFNLFDTDSIKKLIAYSNLSISEIKSGVDQVESKTNEQVVRKYTMVKIKK